MKESTKKIRERIGNILQNEINTIYQIGKYFISNVNMYQKDKEEFFYDIQSGSWTERQVSYIERDIDSFVRGNTIYPFGFDKDPIYKREALNHLGLPRIQRS